VPELIWLSKDLGAGSPTLAHPPRGVAWWRAGAARVVHDGARAYVDLGDRVAVVPLGASPDVIRDGEDLLLTDAAGTAWRIGQGVSRHGGRCNREGTHVEVHRPRGGSWVATTRGRPLALPQGATDARELWPWRSGPGLLWTTEGWLYRWPLDGTPRAVAQIREGDAVLPGPGGAFLVGRGGAWTDGAPPGGSARALPVAVDAGDWGVRWSDDGMRIHGLDLAGEPVRVGLSGGHAPLAGLPLDAEGAVLLGDGTIAGAGAAVPGIREASWALDGRWLGGPGGVVWDLTTGKKLLDAPVLRLGATVATTAGWATADWEDGRGVWVDPAPGRVRDPFAVPLDEDDTIETGAAQGSVAVFTTANGVHWAVEGSRVTRTAKAPSPVPPPPDPSFRVGRDGLVVAGRAFPLPVEAAVRVGGRVWAWSTDGLLVAIPVTG
jgi:hypothetical protein